MLRQERKAFFDIPKPVGNDHDGGRLAQPHGNVNIGVKIVVDGQPLSGLPCGGVGNGDGVFLERIGAGLAEVGQFGYIQIRLGEGFRRRLGLNSGNGSPVVAEVQGQLSPQGQ